MNPRIIRAVAIALMIVVITGFGYQVYLSTQNPIDYLPRRGHAPDFTLPSVDGDNFTLSETEGKIRVLTFIYTKCDQGCALITTKQMEIKHELQEMEIYNEVQLITIDFDYISDTMDDLLKYADFFLDDSDPWQFLLGDENQTHEVTDAYNFTFELDMSDMNETSSEGLQTLEMDHSNHSVVYIHPFLTWFIDQTGEIRSLEIGLDWTVERGVNIIDFLLEEY